MKYLTISTIHDARALPPGLGLFIAGRIRHEAAHRHRTDDLEINIASIPKGSIQPSSINSNYGPALRLLSRVDLVEPRMLQSLSRNDPPRWIQVRHLRNQIPKLHIYVMLHRKGLSRPLRIEVTCESNEALKKRILFSNVLK